MIRTIVVLMIAAVMSFSLWGCGGEKPAPKEEPAEEAVTPPEGSETKPEEEMMEHPVPETEPGAEVQTEGSGTK